MNCVALSAILITLVLANFWVEWRKPKQLLIFYAALVACLGVIYLIPWAELPFGSRAVGTLLAAAYGFPVFFAGIIFAETFRRTEDKSGSFGSNIVGAVAGGLAQNVSFVIGLKALLLLAMVFYVLALVFGRGITKSALLRPTSLSARNSEFCSLMSLHDHVSRQFLTARPDELPFVPGSFLKHRF